MTNIDLELNDPQEKDLARYLRILLPAPVPRLAAGRSLVLAEADRLENRQSAWEPVIRQLALHFSFALVATLLVIGLVFAAALTSSSTGTGAGLFGLYYSSTVAYTLAPATHASTTTSYGTIPVMVPTPQRTAYLTTPAPVPTPQPTLTLLTTLQP